MHVLLLCDSSFAISERDMIRRLEIGLTGEGVATTCAVPERVGDRVISGLITPPLQYRDRGVMLTRSLRAGQLLERLSQSERAGSPVDIVHVFGGGAWGLAAELADQLDAAVALEVWRPGQVDRARSYRLPGGRSAVLLAPDRSIERSLLRESEGLAVRLVRWGVHTPTEPNHILRDERAVSVMVLGPGRDTARFIAAFEAVGRLARENANVMIFVDAQAARRVSIWKRARELDVLSSVSLIDEMEDRRDLVLRGDILVHSDARGEQRTIVLDAMGAGMAVVAQEDPGVSALIENRTAQLVDSSEVAVWQGVIGGLISDPDEARRLGRSARQYVRDEQRASGQIAGVLDAYEWIGSDAAIPFRGATPVR